jgi:serine/threonine protein kinase
MLLRESASFAFVMLSRIAHLRDAASFDPTGTFLSQAHMTPGQVLGSPAIMAPEQLRGEGVDARSDLFSLGVILHTMLTGYRPFQGRALIGTILITALLVWTFVFNVLNVLRGLVPRAQS